MIAPWAQKYIGIPFVTQGRNVSGCDCYGLYRLIMKNEFSISLPLLSWSYTDALSEKETSPIFQEMMQTLPVFRVEKPSPGDAVLIRVGRRLSHMGTYAGGGTIIHTLEKTGSILQGLSSRDFTGRIEGFYRVDQNYSASPSIPQ